MQLCRVTYRNKNPQKKNSHGQYEGHRKIWCDVTSAFGIKVQLKVVGCREGSTSVKELAVMRGFSPVSACPHLGFRLESGLRVLWLEVSVDWGFKVGLVELGLESGLGRAPVEIKLGKIWGLDFRVRIVRIRVVLTLGWKLWLERFLIRIGVCDVLRLELVLSELGLELWLE